MFRLDVKVKGKSDIHYTMRIPQDKVLEVINNIDKYDNLDINITEEVL